jgi:hypothetical protein
MVSRLGTPNVTIESDVWTEPRDDPIFRVDLLLRVRRALFMLGNCSCLEEARWWEEVGSDCHHSSIEEGVFMRVSAGVKGLKSENMAFWETSSLD